MDARKLYNILNLMSKAYYENYWKHEDQLEDFPYKWPVIQKLIPENNKLRFLDFGCGKAAILQKISIIRPNFKIFGIDISDKALSIARLKLPHGVFKLIPETQKIPFPNDYFDFILATDVLEHIYDTQTAFKELARVLKKNGKICITVPYNGKLKIILATIVAFDQYFHPYSAHIRWFSKSSLIWCLKQQNLKPLNFGYFGRFFPLSRGMYVVAGK